MKSKLPAHELKFRSRLRIYIRKKCGCLKSRRSDRFRNRLDSINCLPARDLRRARQSCDKWQPLHVALGSGFHAHRCARPSFQKPFVIDEPRWIGGRWEIVHSHEHDSLRRRRSIGIVHVQAESHALYLAPNCHDPATVLSRYGKECVISLYA